MVPVIGSIRFSPFNTVRLFCAAAVLAMLTAAVPAGGQTPIRQFGRGRLEIVATQPGGTLGLAGGPRETVIWDAAKAAGSKTLRTLTGHTATVRAAKFQTTGSLLVTGGDDKTARVWDMARPEAAPRVLAHSGAVMAVDISTSRVATVEDNYNDTLRIWDAKTTQCLFTYSPFSDTLLALTGDGTKALTYRYGNIYLLDVSAATLGTIRTYPSSTRSVSAAAFSGDEQYFVAGCDDGYARVYRTDTATSITELPGHAGGVSAVAWLPGGTQVLTADRGRLLRRWDALTGQVLKTYPIPEMLPLKRIALLDGGATLMVQTIDNCVRLLNVQSGAWTGLYAEFCGAALALALAPDGRHFAVATDDRKIAWWDAEDGGVERLFPGMVSGVTALAVSPNGARLAAAGLDQTARVWDTASGALLNTLRGHASHVTGVAFTPSGGKLLTGSDDKTARLWNLATSQTLFTFDRQTTSVSAVACAPGGNRVLVGDWVGDVHAYDPVGGGYLGVYQGFSSAVTALAFSPDGGKALVGGCDLTTYTTRLINLADKKTVSRYFGHQDDIITVAFSPTGQRVLTAGYDHTVRVWLTNAGLPYLTLSGFTGNIQALAVFPDGTRVLTAGDDGIVRLWDVSRNGVGVWERYE